VPGEQLFTTLVDQYSIERELGGGGMSRVFLATEIGLGRHVVIKIVAPEIAGDVSTERFAREVKLAARLQQANIVPVLSAGDANGLPYYTMPYVRGESLRARISRGDAVPIGEAVSILRDVARALAFAHGEGVVHRDIKPENILLSGGTAVVTDFGIAKALSASRTLDGTNVTSGITQAGSSIGTPAYMAPEQAAGDPDTDHRADIYAWGVIAWELLGGRHPFAGRTTPTALLAAHMAEKPVSLKKERADVPDELSLLIDRCLEKDASRRPSSGSELIAALDGVVTPSSTTGNVQRATPGRSRQMVLTVGSIALLIVVGIAAYAWRVRSPPSTNPARTIVVIPFENLGAAGDADFADGVTEEIAGKLARIPGLQVVARESVRRFRGSSTPPQEIAKQLGAAYALSGSVRWARSAQAGQNDATVRIVPSLVLASTGLQVWGEPLQEKLTDVFKVQADIAERVASALSVTVGASARQAIRRPESNDPEARTDVQVGFNLLDKRGLANIRQAIKQFDRAIARDSSYARAWAGRAEAYRLLVSYLDPDITYDSAMAIAEPSVRRALALDSLLPEAHAALATVLFPSPHAALRAADRAIELDPGSAAAHSRRGSILMILGKVAESEEDFRRAVELDPLVAAYTMRLGWWYLAAGYMDSVPVAAQRYIELDPTNTALNHYAAPLFAYAGKLTEAVDACVKGGADIDGCRDLWTGLVDTRQGARAIRMLASDKRMKGSKSLMVPGFRATAYARLGMADSALSSLRQSVAEHDANSFAFVNSPWLQPLRSDPRFGQIIGEMRRR
jgi:serine/threonine-protein kinase